MKHYKVIRPSEYEPTDSWNYIKIPWDTVPKEVLEDPGSVSTIYSSETYEAILVVLGKPCRKRSTGGYQVASQDITLYL